MLRKYGIIFLLIILFSQYAKTQREDFRTWISFELEGELFNLIDFSLTPEFRLWDNSRRFEGILGEVDISVPLTKFFRLGTDYRYQIDRNRQNQYHNINRFGAYAELDHKIRGFRLEYRARYYQEYTDIRTSELGLIPQSMHRHKFTLKYRQKGWDITPGIAAEWFFMITPGWIDYQEKFRVTAGIRYRLTKDINLGLKYKYQKEFFENNPLTSHILSLGMEYEL